MKGAGLSLRRAVLVRTGGNRQALPSSNSGPYLSSCALRKSSDGHGQGGDGNDGYWTDETPVGSEATATMNDDFLLRV